MELKKKYILLIVAIAALFFVLMKMHSMEAPTRIKATVYVQDKEINSMDMERDTKLQSTLFFDTIHFPKKTHLTHQDSGSSGFGDNIFVNFECTAEILEEGDYTFTVDADDHAHLAINNEIIVDTTLKADKADNSVNDLTDINQSSRSESVSISLTNQENHSASASKYLKKGTATIKLNYFQKNNKAKLIVHYKLHKMDDKFLIGQSSKYIKFQPIH